MSEALTPSELRHRARRRPGLWLPVSEQPKWTCMVPVIGEGDVQRVCGRTFTRYEESEYIRHVRECARRHEREIAEVSLRNRHPALFSSDGWDEEAEQWMRRNREAVLERRKRLY